MLRQLLDLVLLPRQLHAETPQLRRVGQGRKCPVAHRVRQRLLDPRDVLLLPGTLLPQSVDEGAALLVCRVCLAPRVLVSALQLIHLMRMCRLRRCDSLVRRTHDKVCVGRDLVRMRLRVVQLLLSLSQLLPDLGQERRLRPHLRTGFLQLPVAVLQAGLGCFEVGLGLGSARFDRFVSLAHHSLELSLQLYDVRLRVF